MPWVVGIFGYIISFIVAGQELKGIVAQVDSNGNVHSPTEALHQAMLVALLFGAFLTAIFYASFHYKHPQLAAVTKLQKAFDWGGASVAAISIVLYVLDW